MDDPRPEAENGAAEPRATSTRRVCGVAVLPPGTEEPAALTGAMRRGGVELNYYRSVYAALGAALSAGPAVGVVLLFVEPARFANDQPRRLVRAARRHVAGLGCWRYDPEASPRLAVFGPEETPVVVPRPTPPPRLRLAGVHEDLETAPPEEPTEPSELLTQEEIAMLLDDPAGGATGGPRG